MIFINIIRLHVNHCWPIPEDFTVKSYAICLLPLTLANKIIRIVARGLYPSSVTCLPRPPWAKRLHSKIRREDNAPCGGYNVTTTTHQKQ